LSKNQRAPWGGGCKAVMSPQTIIEVKLYIICTVNI
jgi:hypothetical protein